jgi:hypothetical protein
MIRECSILTALNVKHIKEQHIQTVQSQTYSTINPDQPCMVKEQHIQVVYE